MQPAALTSAHLNAFCQQIVADGVAISVPCQPTRNQAHHECFGTVQQRIAEAGGESIIGWAIWERPGVFIEAEFHAVWRTPAGEYIDVANRPIPFARVTFLPDPQRRYQGRQVDNIRQALVKDIDVTRFLFLASRCHAILNTGPLADQHGQVTLPKKLEREYLKTVKEMAQLEKRLERRYPA